ncbi:MAG: mechanosensitive ion channel domain-containing protein, partial [Candidatus Binatia bacterium]
MQEAIARIIGYAVIVIGTMVGLQTLGVELTSLTVLAGALGVGLGFGLRNVIENFVSGLIILGERPIQLGHRIEVGDAVGRVVQIG